MCVFHFWRFLFESVLQHKPYLEKNEKERLFYLSCWGANTHHLIIFCLSLYNMLYPICEID